MLTRSGDIQDTIVRTPAPLSITGTIFNTVQTATQDPGYTGDGKGFNFRFTIPPGYLISGGSTYKLQIKGVTYGGSVGFCNWEIYVKPTTIP
jgi:hypothetical protein